MSYTYASNQKALAICDVCGFSYRLQQLKELIVKGNKTNVLACPECWNPDQPQNKLGEFPVEDPQALRNPRPDVAEFPQERARIQPANANNMCAFGQVGYVTISIT